MASVKENQFICECISFYDDKEFISETGQYSEPNVLFITDILKNKGLITNSSSQIVEDIKVYSQEYFCPNPYERLKNILNKNTYTIHYLDSSWRSDKGRQDLKRALQHNTQWYRTYENILVLPQKIIRCLLGDERVDRIKERLGK